MTPQVMTTEALYFLSATAQSLAALSAVVVTIYVFVSVHTLERVRYFKRRAWMAFAGGQAAGGTPEHMTLTELHLLLAETAGDPTIETTEKKRRIEEGKRFLQRSEEVTTWRSRSAFLVLVTVLLHLSGIYFSLSSIKQTPDPAVYTSCADGFLFVMLFPTFLTLLWLLLGVPRDSNILPNRLLRVRKVT